MANLSITNTFSSLTKAKSSEVNTNFSDVQTWLNNRDNATDYWLNLTVSATVANPVIFKSSASSTEVAIDNTATDGDPILTFKLSGSQTHVIGVDDSDSDLLKFATTGITTTVAMQVPAVGAQVQFNAGTVSLPGLCFIGSASTGFYQSGANTMRFSVSGTQSAALTDNGFLATNAGGVGNPSYSFVQDPDSGLISVGANVVGLSLGGSEKFEWSATYYTPQTNNVVSLGASGFRWTEVFATNGTINTSHSSTKQDIVEMDPASVKLPPGIFYTRDGRRRIGYLNDDLPMEARPEGSSTDNYEASVIGILCSKVKRLEALLAV